MRKSFICPLIFLTGCMVGPNYQPPQIAMPEKFVEMPPVKKTTPENELCQWWKQFNDPLLDSFIAETMSSNFDLRIAIEKIYQARAQYRIERSYLWPEIDLNAVATRTRNSQNFFNSINTSSGPTSGTSILPTFQNLFEIGFDAIWEFDVWGKYRRAKRAAYYQWEASKEEAQDVLITVVSEVAVNYVTIRSLQQQIDLTIKKIRADEEELLLTKDLFEAGLDSEIQLDTLIATLQSDSAALPVLEASLKQTIYALALLLGRQPENLVSEFNASGPIPSGLDKVPIGLPSDLLRRRPDIKSAERQLAAATEQIGVAVADLFPHISLTGNTFSGGQFAGSTYGYESANLNTLLKPPSRTWSVGPSIRWDIIDFGRTKATIAVQTSLQKQALLTYEQTIINALHDVEGALAAYFEEQRRRVFLSDQVIANRRSLMLTEDLFQAGLASQIQVLEARKILIDSENALIGSEQAVTSDLIALYKALGGNWECSYSP